MIDADKHGLDGGFAVPTGDPGCEQGVGWYYEGKFGLDGVIVEDGNVLRRPSLGTKYSDYDIRVITKGPSEPKPAPKKEEPKQGSQPKQENKPPKSQPKQKSKPKQQQTKSKQETKPKQQSQPKAQHKPQPKQENNPKQQVQNTQKTAQSKQVAKAETKKDENMKKKEEKFKTEEESKKEKENEEKGKKLSVAELKSKNAEVVKEGNKFYAVYKDEEGKEVKQEISEEEAKELGYEADPIEMEPIKETEMGAAAVGNDNNNNASGKGLAIGAVSVLAAGLLGGTYYYFRKRIA